ncbi:MAG: hypothetical protein WCL06_10225 [Bacteroidota bacterium]
MDCRLKTEESYYIRQLADYTKPAYRRQEDTKVHEAPNNSIIA